MLILLKLVSGELIFDDTTITSSALSTVNYFSLKTNRPFNKNHLKNIKEHISHVYFTYLHALQTYPIFSNMW